MASLKLHVDDQKLLVNLELNAQRREHYERINSFHLIVAPVGNGLSVRGGSKVDFQRQEGSGRHKRGSMVKLTNTLNHESTATKCTVLGSDTRILQLLTPKKFNTNTEATYNVDYVYWDQRSEYIQALDRASEMSSPLIETLIHPVQPSGRPETRDFHFVNTNLNDSQKLAVQNSISNFPLAIIHGPPGTGKTTVLIEVILQYHQLFPDARILVTAGSNAAVDNLGVRLLETTISFLRVGKYYRVLDELHGHILKQEQMRSLDSQVEALANVSVVLATLAGCLSKLLIKSSPYNLLIVDESAQSLEFQHWAVVTLGSHLILVGDPRQLPPLVHSRRRRKDLQLSLMERLIGQGYKCDVLNIQHRSNHVIADWSSQRFYHSKIRTAGHVASQAMVGKTSVKDTPFTRAPMVLVNVKTGSEVSMQDGGSLFNPMEITSVVAIVNRLQAAGVQFDDIGIISPYQAQVDLLVKRFDSANKLTIKTVDSFQGSEKDIIGWDIGFVRVPAIHL